MLKQSPKGQITIMQSKIIFKTQSQDFTNRQSGKMIQRFFHFDFAALIQKIEPIIYKTEMGQAYCVKLCGQGEAPEESDLSNLFNCTADDPVPDFAKKVRQHIEIHPKVKETYLVYRTPHSPEKRGVKLELHYLFCYGAYYEGEWRHGLPNGFGRVLYDDGSLYEGCFNNGAAECQQALFIRPDGSFFRGGIRQNKANGYGQLSTGKLFYKGLWKNDLPNGKARQIYTPTSFFEGQFVNGAKQGAGIYQWSVGEYYIGSFKENRIEGKGELFTKQYIYSGHFNDGKKAGLGTYKIIGGEFKYEGRFENDIPKGKGVLSYSDGAVFIGQFQGFEKRKGVLLLKSGERIETDTSLE